MSGPLDLANPLTRIGAVLGVDVVLLLSLDATSAAAALVAELLLLPLVVRRPRRLARRAAPLVLAALLLPLTVALYGRSSGRVLVAVGPVTVSEGSLMLAAALGLRVLALGLPAVVVLAGIDPARLGEALAQRLRLPVGLVLPVVAASRLIGVLGEDRATAALARRARGRSGPRALLASGVGLLVGAVRRGTDLATAMEGRGFGAPGPRTWARRSTFGRADAGLLVGAALVVAAALVAGIAAGTYRVVLVP